MTPKVKSIWDVLTSFEGGKTEEHLKLYEMNPRLYKSAVMFLVMKRAPVRKYLIPKALALAYAKYDLDFVTILHKNATALDVRDAVRYMRRKSYGVSLTGGRNKNRQELVRSYMRNLTPEKMQWQVLTGGRVLTEIADVAHPHPRDWAGEEWIAKTAYGEKPKEGSIIQVAREFRKHVRDNPYDYDYQKKILEQYNIPWHYLRESYSSGIPTKMKKTLIKSFSLRGLIKEIHNLYDDEKELVQALSKDGGHLSFSVPFAKYLNDMQSGRYWVQSHTLPTSVRMALLNLASRQFNKLYFSDKLSPVVIGMDVSGSMQICVEIASTVAAMLASKLDDVTMFSFGPALRKFDKLPKDLDGVMKFIQNIKARGYTNISDFFLRPEVQNARTVVIVSDGGENQPSAQGKMVSDTLHLQNPDQKIFYLYVDGGYGYGNSDRLTLAFEQSENWWRKTKIDDVSQLDQIIPMLSYNDIYGIEDELVEIAGAFVPPLDIETNLCAACGLEVTEPINLGCEHRFHKECLERYWKLLETNYKRCPYGCVPVHRCANCNGPIGVDPDTGKLLKVCGHCSYVITEYV